MREIDGNKLRINGTFADFMESVKEQLESFIDKNGRHPVSFKIKNQCFTNQDGEILYKHIIICKGKKELIGFSVDERDFCRIFKDRKSALQQIVQVRFTDCLGSIECIREDYFLALRQFNSSWRTPDCFEH